MSGEPGATTAAAEIRGLIDEWAGAVRAKDVDAVMRHYAADVVAFDLAPPLQCTGADALRTGLAAWFATFRGPVGYEIRDLHVTAGADVAFCRSLNRISGSRTDGQATGVWVRATIGLRKIDGAWKVTSTRPCPSIWTAATAPRSTLRRRASAKPSPEPTTCRSTLDKHADCA